VGDVDGLFVGALVGLVVGDFVGSLVGLFVGDFKELLSRPVPKLQ